MTETGEMIVDLDAAELCEDLEVLERADPILPHIEIPVQTPVGERSPVLVCYFDVFEAEYRMLRISGAHNRPRLPPQDQDVTEFLTSHRGREFLSKLIVRGGPGIPNHLCGFEWADREVFNVEFGNSSEEDPGWETGAGDTRELASKLPDSPEEYVDVVGTLDDALLYETAPDQVDGVRYWATAVVEFERGSTVPKGPSGGSIGQYVSIPCRLNIETAVRSVSPVGPWLILQVRPNGAVTLHVENERWGTTIRDRGDLIESIARGFDSFAEEMVDDAVAPEGSIEYIRFHGAVEQLPIERLENELDTDSLSGSGEGVLSNMLEE
jgi:hypothetical protein